MACDRRSTQIGKQYDAHSPASQFGTLPTHVSTHQHSTSWELDA
jgi:hypothetical protein